RGFAFNSLTVYSDPDKKRADLYYADPCALFDRCKRLYSRNVALLHDYDLYDFTILVRKHD
ncbi:MAG: class I SAM-dependent methyltransferase, partial [Burkholderiaceae bacterium]